MYFDESGFASNAWRPHGWAPRGKKVFGRINGRRQPRTNLIMAKRGSDWLAPMLFTGTCTHLTVTTWIEQRLLPELRANSLVIMDNAPFHNKAELTEILARAGHTLMPLPRYSPDFNPIEEEFGGLKRQQQFTGLSLDQLITSHS